MKKRNVAVLAVSVLLGLGACGSGNESKSASTEEASSDISTSTSSEEVTSSEEMGVEELGKALSSSAYADEELTGKNNFGLSHPEKVGVEVDEETFFASEKEDSQYEAGRVINFSEITLEDARQYFELDALDDYHAALTCFEKAKALSGDDKAIKINFPEGKLNLDGSFFGGSRAFELTGLKNVDIVGHNTVFNIQHRNLNWKGFMSLSSCENVMMTGFSITSEMPSTLTGQITDMDVNARTSTIKVDPVFNPLVEELLSSNKELCEYLEFDVRSKIPLQGGNIFDRGAFSGYSISGDAENGYSIVVTFNTAIVRSRNSSYVVLAFSEYDISAMSIDQCTNVILENVNLHHACGMGIVSSKTRGLTLNRVNIALEEESHSLMTCTADGLHFNEMHGEVKVLNSLIEYTHDDALNIKHGYWYRVSNADNSTKSLSLTKMTGAVSAPEVGQKVMVYNEDTFEGHNPTAGAYTITEVTATAAGYDLKVHERMSGVNDWGSCRATLLTDTPSFTFKNNIVRNKRNRGILVQVPGAIVENNTFQNIGHGSIQAGSALDQFNECTIPEGITIRNNKFIGNIFLQPEPLYGDISVFALSKNASVAPKGTVKNAVIENNFFTANGNAAICFRGVGNSSIKENFFYECCKNQISGEQNNCIFNAYNAGNIDFANNYSHYTLDLGMSGIILQGLSTEDDIHLVGNTAIDFYRSKDIGPDKDIAFVSSSIAFDGDLADWNGVGDDIEFIAASLATGDEIAIEAVKEEFKINKAKIASLPEGIAMAFDVYDNKRDVKPSASFWTGDCIEILATTLLDMPSADMQVYKNNGGVLQAAFAPTWSASNYATIASARSNDKYLNKEGDLLVGCQSTDTSYTMEFLLPYSVFPEFKEAVDASKRIGIAIVVADSEREEIGRKRVQVGNVPHFVENYKTKSEMMPRYLFEKEN